MPYSSRKKSYRKKRRARSNLTSVQSTASVAPSQLVKLRYVESVVINPATGLVGAHIFSASSIFDPDVTGGGHQPLGRDEWAIFYDHYTVIGSKCTARFFSDTSAANTGNAMVGVMVKDNATTTNTPSTMLEQTNTYPKMLTNSSAQGAVIATKGYSAKRFFGLSNVNDNRTVVGAQFGSSPTDQAYFHVYVTPTTSSDNVGDVNVVVTIEYLCLMTERKTLTAS